MDNHNEHLKPKEFKASKISPRMNNNSKNGRNGQKMESIKNEHKPQMPSNLADDYQRFLENENNDLGEKTEENDYMTMTMKNIGINTRASQSARRESHL